MTLNDDILDTLARIPDLKNRDIILWGAGRMAQQTYLIARTLGANVAAFIDGTDEQVGRKLAGLPIVAADDLRGLMTAQTLVIIASSWWREIGVELINRGFEAGRDFIPAQRRCSNIAWNADDNTPIPTFIGRRTYQYEELLQYFPNVRVLHIGSFCSIALGARVAANHPMGMISTNLFITHRARGIIPEDRIDILESCNPPVRIGNDVWIGRNATIMPGVTIGNGAVIGANATVTKDVPAYAIVVGSPAKVLRYRFSEHQIELLQAVKWWTWSDTKLRLHAADFHEPDRFFRLFERLQDTTSD